MEPIVIIGFGGLAREVYSTLLEINAQYKKFNILGFIDEETQNHNKEYDKVRVLGGLDFLVESFTGVNVVVAIANTAVRRKIIQKLMSHSFRFPNIIHPKVSLGINIKIGEGNIIQPNTTLTCDVSIGNFNIINSNCVLSHDTEILNFCTIHSASVITAPTLIKDNTFLGVNVVISTPTVVQEDTVLPSKSSII